MKIVCWLVAAVSLLCSGCGGGQVRPEPGWATPQGDLGAAAKAVESYYGAQNVEQLRAAVTAVRAAAPNSAEYREIAASLAHLEDRRGEQFEHLYQGALIKGGESARYFLEKLSELSWTFPERRALERLFEFMAEQHQSAGVRSYAAWMLNHSRHLAGADEEREAALSLVPGRLKPSLLGPFDNDQGKGFDHAYTPENNLNPEGVYPGKLLDVSWRKAYPIDPRGKIDLTALMHPNSWQVGYAAARFEVSRDGAYEVRLSTSDGAKVWLDGELVFASRRLKNWMFDGVVIPVELKKGGTNILVKTAQERGPWRITLRVTSAGGEAVDGGVRGLSLVPAPGVGGQGAQGAVMSEVELVEAHVKHMQPSLRKTVRQIFWAQQYGLGALRVKLAETFMEQYPATIYSRFLLGLAAWDNQERGRTADLLNVLMAECGLELPSIGLKQARFWRQQKLEAKARPILVALRQRYPGRLSASLALADSFKGEGWNEERCGLLEEVNGRVPQWPMALKKLATCYEALRFYPKAGQIYAGLLNEQPNNISTLTSLHWLAQGNDEFDKAEAHALQMTEGWPHNERGWLSLAETLRRKGKRHGAQIALESLKAINPAAPTSYMKQAQLAMQSGDVKTAVGLFRLALERDPDNQSTSNRLGWLAPSEEEAWVGDAPDEAALQSAIAAREGVKPMSGANVIYLLDDEVTSLGADGSTFNIVTMVAHAVNQVGRDRLTRMRIRGGRHRMMNAYAVGPDGSRVEASSIRGKQVRFRKLEVGSTVVLQYRVDERPDGYLSGHAARSWWFQGAGVQTHRARWVLYAAPEVTVNESVVGPVKRTETRVGDQNRIEWRAADSGPILREPNMPGLAELAAHVSMSTVPDWETFWKWEQALLVDAFRESPELVDLAKALFTKTETAQEKIDAIQTYLMTEIRYQQDYEKSIAGVKPHAAPQVVERQYGDCKDKAVLFITLARLGGLDVHFALVRTRPAGQVRSGIPMQQFNHAIVYVPKQAGLNEARFYDPTVDALDVGVLRHDDQGTLSAVYDPKEGKHTWRKIPYQPAETDFVVVDLVAGIKTDGALVGDMEVRAAGRTGSVLRQQARNPTEFEQFIGRHLVAYNLPGGVMDGYVPVELKRVDRPAAVRAKVTAPKVGRIEGRMMRFKLPTGWSPRRLFALPNRQYDLVLGTPRVLEWETEIAIPDGATVKRTPMNVELGGPCLTYERTVKVQDDKVVAFQRVGLRCERILAESYAAYREASTEMMAALDEEVVVRLPRKRSGR